MPDEDARLTDFASADDGEAADGDDERTPEDSSPGGGGGDPPDDDQSGADPDPAVPTAAWRPGGSCEACGDPAERRWHDDGAFVCPDCKEW